MFDGEKNQLNNGCNKKPRASTGPENRKIWCLFVFFFSGG